jgi:hypothetical protein
MIYLREGSALEQAQPEEEWTKEADWGWEQPREPHDGTAQETDGQFGDRRMVVVDVVVAE